MKLASNAAVAEQFGPKHKSSEYTVKSTAKTFEVLCSKLYKDKISAIIREICCNALDSHVDAGCPDLPIAVQLPSVFDPHLVIRDYGVGMSPEVVENVYTKFFESTKEDSNEFIGALGLGSKTPFSYVDAFTVTTFYNGLRAVYECFKDRGIPQTVCRSTMPSNEPVGVEVSIPVKTEDMHRFVEAATNIFRWFKVRPVVTGAQIEFRDMPIFGDRGWAVDNSRTISALMGQVHYPIDINIIGVPSSELTSLVIEFAIGDLDVQAGREELSYDPQTIAVIKKRVDQIKSEIDALYTDALKDCRNIFEAEMAAKKFSYEDFPVLKARAVRFRGEVVGTNTAANFLRKWGTNVTRFNSKLDQGQMFGSEKDYLYSNDPKHFTVFVCTRSDGRDFHRLRDWKRDNPEAHGYSIVRSAVDQTFLDAMKGIRVVDSAAVTLPRILAKVRVVENPYVRAATEISVDINEPQHYIMVRNLQWVNPSNEGQYISDDCARALWPILTKHTETNKAIYYPISRKKDIGENWINLYDVLHEKYKELRKNKTFITGIRRAIAWENFKTNLDWSRALIHACNYLEEESELRSFGQLLKEVMTTHEQYKSWVVYESIIGVHRRESMNLNLMWDRTKSRYPLAFEFIKPHHIRGPYERDIAIKELSMYAVAKENILGARV